MRYVLEGSVQRSGKQVRINAQLIDAETDAHVWAERFERGTGDLFALQNEITSRLALALNLALIGAEVARPTDNPDALDYFFRGRAAYWKPSSRAQRTETIGLFEHSLALDPSSVEVQSELANMLAARTMAGWSDSPADDIARAEGLVAKALAASPRSALAHSAEGAVLRTQGRCDDAIPEYETVVAVDRSWVSVYALYWLGGCKLLTGAIEEVVPLEEKAIHLSPRDPLIAVPFGLIGLVYLLQSRTDEAILWLEKARTAEPGRPIPRSYLASAYGLKGETERAAAELAEVRRLIGDDRYASVARLKAVGYQGTRNYWGVSKIRTLLEATYFAGLRKAGMPEE